MISEDHIVVSVQSLEGKDCKLYLKQVLSNIAGHILKKHNLATSEPTLFIFINSTYLLLTP